MTGIGIPGLRVEPAVGLGVGWRPGARSPVVFGRLSPEAFNAAVESFLNRAPHADG